MAKLASAESQGYKKPEVKKVVISEPPSPERPYYVIPGGNLREAWMVNVPDYKPGGNFGYKDWQQDDYRNVPNYEKLTRAERWIMDRLPGFSESDVGKALEKFNASWAGRMLQYVDVPAEGLERATGLFTQAAYAATAGDEDFQDQLKAAWYAGSLAADYANMTVTKDPVTGQWGIPQELPGMAGLVNARLYINNAIKQGRDPGEALIEARDAAYGSQGALALRMQMNDAFFHIFADPLNVVAGAIKPVETSMVGRVLKGAKALPEEVVRATGELQTAAESARAAGKLDELADIEKAIETVQNMQTLGPWEQRFLRVAGAMPGEKAVKLPGPLNLLLKPFQMTPDARAYEFVDNVERNVLAYILNPAKDPHEMVRQLQRLADGTLDPQLAHMIVRPEGRILRGVAQSMAAKGTDMLNAYDATVAERKILEAVSMVLGDTPVGVMQRLAAGEGTVVTAKVLEAADAVPEVGQLFDNMLIGFGRSREMLGDELGKLPSLFKGVDLYSPELFRLHMTNMAADVAAEAGVALFGVKARGVLQAASESLKAAETLAFLRLNPAYPIMNWVNNNITMLARGTFGSFPLDYAYKLWDDLGFTPPRLKAGIGMAGEAENLTMDSIAKASRAEKGWVTDIGNWFRGRNLGKLDMGMRAKGIEKTASMRAYTAGYLRGNAMFSKKLVRKIADFDPELAAALGDDVASSLENTIRSSMTASRMDAAVLGDNLNMSMRAVLDDASRRLGYQVDSILTPEFTAEISDNILRAARQGPTAVTEELARVRIQVQKSIDNMVDESIQVIIDETMARVSTEGPGAFPDIWAQLGDEFWAAHPKHADQVAKVVEAAQTATDPKIAHVLWTQGLEAENAYMGRMWNRLEAYVEGFRKGAKKLDLPYADDIARQFRNWRNGWQGFFGWRNQTYDEFFSANLKGEKFQLGFDQISAEADARYFKLADAEEAYLNNIDSIASKFIEDPTARTRFLSGRGMVAELRRMDRNLVKDYMVRARGLDRAGKQALMEEMWANRRALWAHIGQHEQMAKAAMQGNPEALSILDEDVALRAAATEGAEAAPEVAAGAAEEAPEVVRMWEGTTLGDFHEFVPRQQYMGTGIDQLWFTRGDDALQAIGDSALDAAAKRPLKLADVPEELMPRVRAYLEEARRGVSDTNYAAMKFGEYTRDSALLNYNRRLNYNTWLGTLAPYEFWLTQSTFKWALHTIDRPAMVSTFLRLRKFLETGYRPEANLPERLRGSIRIRLPFMPGWMGDDLFVDPLKMLLPFDRFAYPVEAAMQQRASDEGQVNRVLEEMLQDGTVTEEEYNQALATKTGPVWDRAEGLARLDDQEGRKNGMDFMSMMVMPHAPIMWAYNIAKGTPEDISPFLPITRSIKGLTGLLGIGPAGGYNPEAAIRRALGLPAFDKWDDYRVDRMLSNMAGDGEISVEVAKLAMIERQKATKPEVAQAFRTAQDRAGREFGIGAMGSLLGMPAKPYPTGEERLREMQVGYEAAWKEYENGNPKAIQNFYDKHPEYETRLALFKTPEERLRTFMVDQLWDQWNEMPKLWKDEAEEQLGQDFQNLFLNKDTRAYDMIPLDTLQVWVKLMGGEAPGQLKASVHLDVPPVEIANRAQVFYDTRTSMFPDWYDEQQQYYKLDEGSPRRAYRRAHPQFASYQAWRWDWLEKNPDVAPYLTDNPPTYRSEAALRQAQAGQPNFSSEQWAAVLGQNLYRLVLDSANGAPLPESARSALRDAAQGLGMEEGDIVDAITQAESMLAR